MGVVIPLDKGRNQAASLAPLMALVADDMDGVNELIMQRVVSNVELIPELARHLIDSGGKRIRPMLTIAAAQMCGYEGKHHIKLASSVEFMHTATLLHDDVVDESEMRRGNKTARILWGNEASVLVGDFLLGQAFKMMVETGSLDCLAVLSDAAAVIAEGEVMQLAAAQHITTTEDAYLAVIKAKTAALFAAAAHVGGIISDQSPERRSALDSYGRNLGLVFQLIDDALDYSGDAGAMGKSVGDDFREGKITLPVVLTYRRGNEDERKFWKRALEDRDQRDGDLEQAISLMKQHNALEDTISRAHHYGAIACDALEIFPKCTQKSALMEVVRFCVDRSY